MNSTLLIKAENVFEAAQINQFWTYIDRGYSRPTLIASGVGLLFLAGTLRAVFSSEGVMSFGLEGFVMVLPLYLIASLFFNNFNDVGYTLLFFLSGILYSGVVYYLCNWLEDALLRHKNRPKFEYKRVSYFH